MLKNSLMNVESDNNKILYETLLDFVLQRNGTYSLNKPRITLRNPTLHPMNRMFQHLTYEACCTSLRHSYFQDFGKSHCTYFALLGN